MSESALYDKVNASSGQIRIVELNALREHLLAEVFSKDEITQGLKQRSQDVRRVVLDVLSIRSATESYDKVFLTLVIGILKDTVSSADSISAFWTASSALRCLCGILKQDISTDPLTSLEVQDIAEVALRCLSYGLHQSPSSVSGVRRSSSTSTFGPGYALAFERNGGIPQRSAALSTYPIQKRGSTASLASQYSTKCGTSNYDTDHSTASDDDIKPEDNAEKRQRRLAEASKSVRYRSIACISVLNEKAGRLLLVEWPRLLVDSARNHSSSSLVTIAAVDTFVSNRISAVRTIQSIITSGAHSGFMIGAEERVRLAAFTSLSSRIASVVVDLRKGLLHLLLDTDIPVSLLEATIKCTKAVVMATEQVKLHTSHSQVLRPVTLKLCSHADVKIAIPAYSLLSALANKERGVREISGAGILDTLKDRDKPLDVQIGAWTALTASMSTLLVSNEDVAPLLRDVIDVMQPVELRQAAAAYILACLVNLKASFDIAIIDRLSQDPSPIIRATAADCLAYTEDNEELMSALLGDSESTVRASAIRAIGVKVKNGEKVPHAEQYISRLVQDDSLLVRMRASWALGNLCEHYDNHLELLLQCHSLRQDDEKVSLNAIRGVGAVLSRCSIEELKQSQSLLKDILTWLISALSSGTPKIRWNAAACFARAFETRSTSQHLLTLFDVTEPFSRCLVEDKAFKVRLSLAQAILNLVQHDHLKSTSIKAAVQEATTKVEEQIKEATFKEIQLHGLPLQQLLTRLMLALQE